MSFTNDVFISYAHIDNQPVGETRGWIDTMTEWLSVRLTQLLGAEATVWRDSRLQGDQYFAGEIGDNLAGTRLLVPIVTPRYVKSEWCRGELREFCERAARARTERNQSRVFKIAKTPVDDELLPDELRGLLGYVFYEHDDRGRPREFDPGNPPRRDSKYWQKLEDLAWDIKEALEKLKAQQAPVEDKPKEPLPLEKKVYLAETTADLADERDRVRRELQQHGYYVLPDRTLPLVAADLEAEVREHLDRAALSIHLIGESYGVIPDGEEERSVVRLQAELAAERAGNEPGFTQLIWMPVGLAPKGKRQQEYVEALLTVNSTGAELFQTPLEDLKARALEKLKSKPPDEAHEENGLKRVYLVCDNRDLDGVAPIGDFLFEQGYEVIPPINEGDTAQVAQYHRESLVSCDAALIYYGSASQLWLRLKMMDLLKAPGWGRTRPMLASTIYVSSPETKEKQQFRTREVPVIQNFGGFSPDVLRPFVSALSAREGGRG